MLDEQLYQAHYDLINVNDLQDRAMTAYVMARDTFEADKRIRYKEARDNAYAALEASVRGVEQRAKAYLQEKTEGSHKDLENTWIYYESKLAYFHAKEDALKGLD